MRVGEGLGRGGNVRRGGDFRLRKSLSPGRYLALSLAAFGVILAAWLVLSLFGIVRPLFLPSPVDVVRVVVEDLRDGSLWVNMGYSVFRVMLGFLLSALLALPIGIFAGSFRPVEAVIAPVCEFVRYMPVPAFVPLVMVWFGIGEGAKVFIVFLGCFFQMVLMVADDARSVPDDLLAASYTLGTRRLSTITRVLIPAMAPRVMQTLRMIVGWGWTYLTVAELVASKSGLGYSILLAQRFLRTDRIFAGILVIGILGLITDRLFVFASKRLFPWAE